MNKKLIRLTESDLHKIVKESVNKILKESNYNNYFDWANRSGASDDEIEREGNRFRQGLSTDEGFPYMIVTYQGEQEVDRQYVNLPREGLHAYDDEVPFTLGSNQALIELD